MQAEFGVFEILQIAEKIQENGVTFYLRMAEMLDDPQLCCLCRELAAWRVERAKIYAGLRGGLCRREGEPLIFGTDDYVLSHPWVMADLGPFPSEAYPVHGLSSARSTEEVLATIIKKEADVMVFYHGLQGFARNQAGRDLLEKLVGEEQHHMSVMTHWVEHLRCQSYSAPALQWRDRDADAAESIGEDSGAKELLPTPTRSPLQERTRSGVGRLESERDSRTLRPAAEAVATFCLSSTRLYKLLLLMSVTCMMVIALIGMSVLISSIAEKPKHERRLVVRERTTDAGRLGKGAPVEVFKLTEPTHAVDSRVISVGPADVEIPESLWKDPNIPQWGRPFVVKVPPDLNLRVGDRIGIRRL